MPAMLKFSTCRWLVATRLFPKEEECRGHPRSTTEWMSSAGACTSRLTGAGATGGVVFLNALLSVCK
jgi:hypothetical protein